MKYLIVFRNRSTDSEFTCEAFPYDGDTAEESLVSCINYFMSSGENTLVSVSTAPLTGDEVPFDPDI